MHFSFYGFLFLILSSSSLLVFAEDADLLDQEVMDLADPVLPVLEEAKAPIQAPSTKTPVQSNKKSNSNAEVEFRTTDIGATPGTISPNPREIFKNPGGSEKVIKVYHPGAQQGLIRINKDKSYQYKVPVIAKSKATGFSFSYVSAPKISSAPASNISVDYETMYGGSNIYGLLMNHEWMPFRKYGSLGVLLEGGISYSHGNGTLVSGGNTYPAQESYTLFIVPLSAFIKYRLEFWRNQWFVPYIEAGGTYYGLGELRSGDNKFRYAGAPAAGGGGGVQINLSKFDPHGSYSLAHEYGVADLWLNFEARKMAGLKNAVDFSSTTINFGIVADY
jgi:hypothetical protein